jgi:UDP-N-acetylmuramoyl-L-alanyl-D-glutamate--2,6-diaminopimelate ligase
MGNFLHSIKKLIPGKIFLLLRPTYHFLLAFLAALFYGFPSQHLYVVGVTGTKGKTTVVELLHSILEESSAEIASLSSLRFRIGEEITDNDLKMTMPGRFFVQKFLREAVRRRCTYAVIEVTSEGIKQFRHRFINFDAALVTNVAPEHIEAHGSFELYLRAKLDLFWRLPKTGLAIINRDDPSWQRFSAATKAQKIFYGKEGIESRGKTKALRDLYLQNGISFDIGSHTITSNLQGEFNFYNICAALAFGLSRHMALERLARGIAKVAGIPGRMEYIKKEPFAVIVDYAHTPDSLQKVYETLRESGSKLICVLGSAGGGRDKWKRAEMGKIAGQFCSSVILTNEDPYDEDPESIIKDISSGVPHGANVTKKIDRREAIKFALRLAGPGDTVVITGKGAEPWIMGPQGTKMPWDDRKIVREELEKI